MTFSGIAAVQAQIQAIEQQVGAVASPAAAATAGSGAATGSDFASLLTDAMNTQTAVDAGNTADASDPNNSGTSTTGTSNDLSSLLGEASALTASNAPSALDPTSSTSGALGSLVSSLTGTASSTSPDLSSLLSSLTGTASSTSPDISSLLSSLIGATGGTDASTSPDLSSLLAGLTGAGATSPSPIAGAPNVTTQNFLDAALSQQGKPYVWGAKAPASDANPSAFDCSGLTTWAAARAGVTIPNGAAHQYVWLKEQGATMTVQQALQTPGALLFHFDSEPQPGLSSEPPDAHVAISLGNGMTMEAKGHAYGVGVFQAGDRFNYAGMIPGMT
ncbi:MAG: C40 family peptidase [Acidimicrobiia bacterium]